MFWDGFYLYLGNLKVIFMYAMFEGNFGDQFGVFLGYIIYDIAALDFQHCNILPERHDILLRCLDLAFMFEEIIYMVNSEGTTLYGMLWRILNSLKVRSEKLEHARACGEFKRMGQIDLKNKYEWRLCLVK